MRGILFFVIVNFFLPVVVFASTATTLTPATQTMIRVGQGFGHQLVVFHPRLKGTSVQLKF